MEWAQNRGSFTRQVYAAPNCCRPRDSWPTRMSRSSIVNSLPLRRADAAMTASAPISAHRSNGSALAGATGIEAVRCRGIM
jgi:hypothetical protein